MTETLDQKNEYIKTLDGIPVLLSFKRSEIFINKNAFSSQNDKNLVKTEKLKATGYGDWDLSVLIVNSKFIESRENLDNMVIMEDYRAVNNPDVNLDKVSIEKAMKLIDVDISCNMDYYLSNKEEMQNDLNRKMNKGEDLKYVEQELFYKQMFRIFGDIEDNDDDIDVQENGDTSIYGKSFILKDFRILSHDGNTIYATARRGEFYILFSYVN